MHLRMLVLLVREQSQLVGGRKYVVQDDATIYDTICTLIIIIKTAEQILHHDRLRADPVANTRVASQGGCSVTSFFW
jgi:hypothetical protein